MSIQLNSKKVTNIILSIKRAITDIIRDRLYIKDFSKQIIEHLYEIDDYSKYITVNIVQKTDIHKCLKPLLQFSDAYFEMKEVCYNLLESILFNLKRELFNSNIFKSFHINNYDTILFDCDKESFVKELETIIEERNKQSDKEDCFIRTDGKYLEQIKKSEINTMMEAKRRQKMRRFENERCIIVEEENQGEEKNETKIEPIIVKKRKDEITIIVNKKCLTGMIFEHTEKNTNKKNKSEMINQKRKRISNKPKSGKKRNISKKNFTKNKKSINITLPKKNTNKSKKRKPKFEKIKNIHILKKSDTKEAEDIEMLIKVDEPTNIVASQNILINREINSNNKIYNNSNKKTISESDTINNNIGDNTFQIQISPPPTIKEESPIIIRNNKVNNPFSIFSPVKNISSSKRSVQTSSKIEDIFLVTPGKNRVKPIGEGPSLFPFK